MKKSPLSFALGCALSLGAVALVPPAVAETVSTPVAGSATVTEITGTVTAIDIPTRKLTIRTPDGQLEVLDIPPQVKRIKNIKVGNKLTATVTEAVLVDIERGRDAGAMGAIGDTTVTPEPGRKPAGTITERMTLYGKVVSVDRAASQVTIRGADRTLTLKVKDPATLKLLAPGDGVVARYVRSISGKVELQ